MQSFLCSLGVIVKPGIIVLIIYLLLKEDLEKYNIGFIDRFNVIIKVMPKKLTYNLLCIILV